MRNVVSIERWEPSEQKYVEYYREENIESVRWSPGDASRHYHRPPSGDFRAYGMEDARDFEGDPCMLVCLEVLHFNADTSDYPILSITGRVVTMKAAHEVADDPDYGGKKYTPEKDPDWRPASVRIRVWPYGTMLGETE